MPVTEEDRRIGRPVIYEDPSGLTLGDLRQFIADMEDSGADGSAPVFAARIERRRAELTDRLTAIGGYPRVTTGPVPAAVNHRRAGPQETNS